MLALVTTMTLPLPQAMAKKKYISGTISDTTQADTQWSVMFTTLGERHAAIPTSLMAHPNSFAHSKSTMRQTLWQDPDFLFVLCWNLKRARTKVAGPDLHCDHACVQIKHHRITHWGKSSGSILFVGCGMLGVGGLPRKPTSANLSLMHSTGMTQPFVLCNELAMKLFSQLQLNHGVVEAFQPFSDK